MSDRAGDAVVTAEELVPAPALALPEGWDLARLEAGAEAFAEVLRRAEAECARAICGDGVGMPLQDARAYEHALFAAMRLRFVRGL